MQPLFPTKKFFIVLLFLVLVAGGAFKLFKFLNSRNAEQHFEEQKIALLQNEVLRPQINATRPSTPAKEPRVATSTLNAVAAVVYLNEQTKANGATMKDITARVGKEIQDAKIKLDTDVYTKNDLLIDADNSPEAIKKYGNDMAGIFLKYGQVQASADYLTIVKRALETKSPKELKKIEPYINFYKNIIRDSLLLKVPSSAASIHLDIINSYAQMLGILQGFLTVLDNPAAAIASNSRLTKASVRFLDSYKKADDYFKEKGVVFSPGENGGLFASTVLK